MTREVIHIGFPKTATSTLQEHLFGVCDGLTSLARPFPNERTSVLCIALALRDDDEFDEAELSAAVAKARSDAPGLMVYSDETVVNSPIRCIAAKRLKRLFPDAHVLAVLRSQPEALASNYANSGRRLRPAPEPYSGRHVTFENYLSFNYANPKRHFLRTLDYDATLGTYEELFGAEKVHVLLFEEFLHDMPAFTRKLAGILDIESGEIERYLTGRHSHKRTEQAIGSYQALRSRFLWGVPLSRIIPGSRYLKPMLFRFWGDKPLEVTYPEGWEEKVGDLFRAGNRNVQDRYDLPLERHGYPL